VRRWLFLLIGGTLAFGLFCFGSGLVLGIHLGGGQLAIPELPHSSGNQRESAGPAVSAPAAALQLPTITSQPGGAQIVAPAAATPPASSAGATPVPQTAATAGAAAPGQTAAGSLGGGPANGGAPVGHDALPIQPVADLLVGLPADAEAVSPLRGPLVSSAMSGQGPAVPNQPTSAQTPGPDSAAPPAGAKPAAGSVHTDNTVERTRTNDDRASAAPPRVFAVRVGAYLDVAAAQRRAAFLLNQGYHPLIVSFQQPGEGLTWYSVVLDQRPDLSAAHREAAQFAREQGQEPDVVSWTAAPIADARPPAAPQR
jgi:SPOR domain